MSVRASIYPTLSFPRSLSNPPPLNRLTVSVRDPPLFCIGLWRPDRLFFSRLKQLPSSLVVLEAFRFSFQLGRHLAEQLFFYYVYARFVRVDVGTTAASLLVLTRGNCPSTLFFVTRFESPPFSHR